MEAIAASVVYESGPSNIASVVHYAASAPVGPAIGLRHVGVVVDWNHCGFVLLNLEWGQNLGRHLRAYQV